MDQRVNSVNSNGICCGFAWTAAIAILCTAVCGCSRAFWRKHADQEAYALLDAKTRDPRWYLPRLDIEPDPRSRFYDPYNPDAEPLPPDDPAAHEFMHYVSGMRGYKSWHKLGQAFDIENPHWLAAFELPPSPDHQEADAPDSPPDKGSTLPEMQKKPDFLEMPGFLPGIKNLTLQQAIELSYIHSRRYQTEIEDLYLASLDLTFDRFRFDVRYLGVGGRKPTADLEHESIPGGENSLALNSRFGISRLLPTGAQWAVELANNTLWLFSGPNQTNTASVLSYSLVQPLLLGAGRKIVLEDLTQSERNVLYASRDLARFRKEFFTETVAGFLGLLQDRQVVVNQQGNIRRIEKQVALQRTLASQRPRELSERLPALPPGLQFPPAVAGQIRYDAEQKLLLWRGDMTEEQKQILLGLSQDAAFLTTVKELISRLRIEMVTLEVAQLETRLANSRNALRQSERSSQDSLDLFKIQLGLPPDMKVTIDESLLKQFELIDPRLADVQETVEQFVGQWARLDEDDPNLAQLRQVVVGLKRLQADFQKHGLQLIEEDFGRVKQNMADRLSRLHTDEDRQRVIKDIDRDRRLFESIRQDFATVGRRLQKLSDDVALDNLGVKPRQNIRRSIADLREQLLRMSQSLQVIQIDLRVELIALERFDLPMPETVRLGLENRLDLMNERARVMDARRRVEIAANRLEAVLDLKFEGDVRTPTGTRPFDFRGSRSSFRAGIAFTAPLDQIAERNDYRAALIAYQRARRDYMEFEDQVKLEIRQSWRQLSVLAENFELTRQAVRFAALQYDQTIEASTAPVRPGQRRTGSGQGVTLLNALSDVLNAQNRLIGIWVDYERRRLNIHRDMGIMEVDARGIWKDEFYQPGSTHEQPTDAVPESRPRDPTTSQFPSGGESARPGGDGALGRGAIGGQPARGPAFGPNSAEGTVLAVEVDDAEDRRADSPAGVGGRRDRPEDSRQAVERIGGKPGHRGQAGRTGSVADHRE